VAVWIERTTSPDQVWSRSRPSGGNWGSVTQIFSPAIQTSLLLPQVRIGAAGFATAIWLDDTGLSTADRPAASPWSSPQLLSSDPLLGKNVSANPSLEPSFEMNSGGDAAIVWLGRSSVVAVTRPAGGAWTSPQTVASPGSGAGVTSHDAAISANGTVIAIWDTFQIICTTATNGKRFCHNANFVLHASRRDPATGTWADSGGLLGPDVSAHVSRAALDASGRAMLVALNAAGAYVSSTQGATGGAWSPFQTAATPGSSTEGTALASDDAGDVTLAYQAASQVFAVSGSMGANAFAAPEVVSGADTGVGNLSLALAPNGNALIDWMVGGSASPEVRAAFRATAKGSWGSPMTVSGPGCSALGGSCTPEALAVNSSGNGLLIYSGYDAAQVHTEYATNYQP
jgi:hypothetical protein